MIFQLSLDFYFYNLFYLYMIWVIIYYSYNHIIYYRSSFIMIETLYSNYQIHYPISIIYDIPMITRDFCFVSINFNRVTVTSHVSHQRSYRYHPKAGESVHVYVLDTGIRSTGTAPVKRRWVVSVESRPGDLRFTMVLQI